MKNKNHNSHTMKLKKTSFLWNLWKRWNLRAEPWKKKKLKEWKKKWINISDNTNVAWLQTFHLYKGFFRKASTIGFFLKGSSRVIEPPRYQYKGYKTKSNKKGDICRALLIRSTFPIFRKDGSSFIFKSNAAILIKKKQNPKSKFFFGPTLLMLRRKRFKALFNLVI